MGVACESWLGLLESNQLFSRARLSFRHAYARAAFHSVSTNCNYIVLLPAALLYSHNACFVVLCFPHWKSSYCVAPFWKRPRLGSQPRRGRCRFPRNAGRPFFCATRQLEILPATQAFLLPKTCIESQNVSQ
jgi:hypothetical protein